MSGPRGIALLGATGSVGASTLDVVARHPGRFRVVAVSARDNVRGLAEICERHRPELAVISDPARERALREALSGRAPDTTVMAGPEGLEAAATHASADSVMAAIVGAAGLPPTLAAARAGKRVLLANKEALVMAGPVFMDAVENSGAELLPIDSEHNAVFQCLGSAGRRGVERITLTASGGPFLRAPLSSLDDATPAQACAHPTWNMGRKISVDSATLMNKGLELIEAHWLFDVPDDALDVLIHPQSIVHSLVGYTDGSVLAQMANPDMRVPIAHALAHPDRVDAGVAALDLGALGRLEFEPPDLRRFPCLRLARQALRAGGSAATALNAANEVAVAAFLEGRIRFTGIARIIEAVLSGWSAGTLDDLDAVLASDAEARELARRELDGLELTH